MKMVEEITHIVELRSISLNCPEGPESSYRLIVFHGFLQRNARQLVLEAMAERHWPVELLHLPAELL